MLLMVKKGEIYGVISEVVLDEVLSKSAKLGKSKELVEKKVLNIFPHILPAPQKSTVESYKRIVIDHGDSHILASCKEYKSDYLITLDQKH